MKRSVLLAVLVVGLSVGTALAQSTRGSREAALTAYINQHPETKWIRTDKDTGVLRSLVGTVVTTEPGTALDTANDLLLSLRSIYGIRDAENDLVVSSVMEDSVGGLRVRWQQLFNGVPVEGGGLVLSLSTTQQGPIIARRGNSVIRRPNFWSPEDCLGRIGTWRIHGINGFYHPEIIVANHVALSAESIVDLVTRDVGRVSDAEEAVLWIMPTRQETGFSYRFVYHLPYHDAGGQGLVDVRDAQTGILVDRRSAASGIRADGLAQPTAALARSMEEARFLTPRTSCCTLVTGLAYPSNPLRSSATSLDVPVYDNPGNYILDNTRFDVIPDDGAPSRASVSYPSIPFDWGANDPRFREYMTAYHAWTTWEWMWDKGMSSNQIPKYTIKVRNSLYVGQTDPPAQTIYLGRINSTWSMPEKEGAIVAHEIAHAVEYSHLQALVVGSGDATESLWMGEAYSDYFGIRHRLDVGGATSTGILEYVVNVDYSPYGGERDIDNTHLYSEIDTDGNKFPDANWDNNSVANKYDASLVLSGALWDYDRTLAVDDDYAPYFILHSLGNLSPTTDYDDALTALILTIEGSVFMRDLDQTWSCSTDCTSLVETAFGAHGIGEGGGERIASGRSWLDSQSFEDLDTNSAPTEFKIEAAYPNPFNPTTTIALELSEPADVTMDVLDLTGAVVARLFSGHVEAGHRELQWSAEDVASGTYFIRARIQDRFLTKPLVLLKRP